MLPLSRCLPFLACASVISAGCGGGSSPLAQQQQTPSPDFSIAFSSNAVTVSQGATAPPVNLSVTGQNGFSGAVQVSLTLPSGAISNPVGPFSVNAGASVPLLFAAETNANIGNFSVSAQATSGSLSHSASLTLSIQQGIAASLPRTTFVRTDASPGEDNAAGEPHHQHMVYDSARKQLYVANRAMNRVEVFSTSTLTRIAQVNVPAATSVDLSADGTTLWVGTLTNLAVALDPSAFQIRARYTIPLQTPIPNTTFERPEEILALANGNAYVRLRQPTQAEALLALWTPGTNALTNLTSVEPQVFQNGVGPVARTGDHSKVLVGAADNSGELAIFDSNGNAVAGPHALGLGQIPYVAANSDGSRFAAVFTANGSSQIMLLDSSLNLISSSPITAPSSLVFSLDGTALYFAGADVITALSSVDLHVFGSVSDVAPQGVSTQLEAADETGMIFGLSNRGIAFLDAAHPASLPTPGSVLAPVPSALPAEGPNVGGTTITVTGQNFTQLQQVAIGTQAAANATENSGMQIVVTSPPNVFPGPVNLTAYFANGSLALAPDGFSYGPQILQVSPNAGSASGGDTIQIYGYGFGSDPAKVLAKIGGANATVQSIDAAPAISTALNLAAYPFPLERVTLTTPAGTAGNADIMISAPAGSTTIARGFQFLQNIQFFGKPGFYKFVVYDQHRGWLYLSNIDHVEVFDRAAQQFHANPLEPPGGPPPTAGLRGLALTPDASQLAVADFGSQKVYLLNPDTGAGTAVSTGGVPGFAASGPARVAATSTQTIFVGLSGEGGSGAGCSACLDQLNLAASPPTVQPAPQPQLTSIVGAPLLASNGFGDQVFVAFGTASSGPLAFWNAASPNQFTTVPVNAIAADLGVASDGTSFASAGPAGVEIRSAALSLTAAPFAYELAQIPGRTSVPGVAVHPSGALVYQPFLTGPAGSPGTRGGIDIIDANTGVLRLRIFLAQQLLTDVDGLHGSFLTIDENGQRLFALTSSDGSAQNAGVTIVTLAAVPLGIGSVTPSSASGTAGTRINVRGSGFQNGATVTFSGKPASVTFNDTNTLTVITPALSPGPQQITITNPDGQSYTLDAALTVN